MTWWTGGVLAVVGVVVGALMVGGRAWRAESAAVVDRLRAREVRAPGLVSLRDDLEGLPPPVVRYFRRVLRDQQPLVSSATIRWEGEFNMGTPTRDTWRPFTAVQDYVPGAPGFVWNATIQMMPGVPVYIRDAFVDGHASMKGAVVGLVPVVNTAGTPTLASGALQRYLGEAVWFPTALLPRQGVRWSSIDDDRARATISAGATTVSLECRFDGEGHMVSVFAPDRFYDDGKSPPVPRPWEGRNLAFGERDGMTVPTDSLVLWRMPEGEFVYWRGRPTAIDYHYAGALRR
jgi:hypothetical protein